jgi:hypothetical protein
MNKFNTSLTPSTETNSSVGNKASLRRGACLVTAVLLPCCGLFPSCAPDLNYDYYSDIEYPAAGYDSHAPGDAIVGRWKHVGSTAGVPHGDGLILHEDGTGMDVDPRYERDGSIMWAYQGAGIWGIYPPEIPSSVKYYRVSQPSPSGERTLYCLGYAPINQDSTSIKYLKMN